MICHQLGIFANVPAPSTIDVPLNPPAVALRRRASISGTYALTIQKNAEMAPVIAATTARLDVPLGLVSASGMIKIAIQAKAAEAKIKGKIVSADFLVVCLSAIPFNAAGLRF